MITHDALAQLEALTSTVTACAVLGVPRASVYRARAPRVHGPAPRRTGGTQPAALGATEREAILAVLDSERFVDKSATQVWAVLLDEGVYLGSVSTYYRVLRAAGQVKERRAQATHPARVRPELLADAPHQVWTWDITKLKGPHRGEYYDAYVMLDIYSRKAVHHEVHTGESGALAARFIEAAIAANNGTIPTTIHSDNGTSMTSKNVAALLTDLNITASRSRPKVSNDNPYSEAAFKTLKYCPAFPEAFTDLTDARDFMNLFFDYYNHDHRHSGIGLHTPASVHDGTWQTIHQHRQDVLDAAYTAHPERFPRGRPHAPALPTRAWINRPPATIETA